MYFEVSVYVIMSFMTYFSKLQHLILSPLQFDSSYQKLSSLNFMFEIYLLYSRWDVFFVFVKMLSLNLSLLVNTVFCTFSREYLLKNTLSTVLQLKTTYRRGYVLTYLYYPSIKMYRFLRCPKVCETTESNIISPTSAGLCIVPFPAI